MDEVSRVHHNCLVMEVPCAFLGEDIVYSI
nr:MAG TPA: hypothetical protein [Caudoviricetes sp.]